MCRTHSNQLRNHGAVAEGSGGSTGGDGQDEEEDDDDYEEEEEKQDNQEKQLNSSAIEFILKASDATEEPATKKLKTG